MNDRTHLWSPRARRLGVLPLVLTLVSVTAVGRASAQSYREVLRFAAEMAERGNWREALFRWENAAAGRPKDAKLQNNLGVAQEALGDVEAARRHYRNALRLSPGDETIRSNLRQFDLFWKQYGPRDEDEPPRSETDLAADGGGKLKGKVSKVVVGLPVPPRLELSGDERVLVTSFLAEETDLIDVNREMVRFLRSALRRETGLDVLDVTPPPAVPEQTIEDLLANREFWRYLGRNYEADVIVSGVVIYDREDASTFRDVDVISPTTGQKVRQSRFVEQEMFAYGLEIFFIEGPTGELLFRDRMQRSVIFQGSHNDPLSAFYALSDSIAADVLSVVTTRVRPDARLIFKK